MHVWRSQVNIWLRVAALEPLPSPDYRAFQKVFMLKEALKIQQAVLVKSEEEALCDQMTVLLQRMEVLALWGQGWVTGPTDRAVRIQTDF